MRVLFDKSFDLNAAEAGWHRGRIHVYTPVGCVIVTLFKNYFFAHFATFFYRSSLLKINQISDKLSIKLLKWQ